MQNINSIALKFARKYSVNPKEMGMGIRHELEHTVNPFKSAKFALTHLKEIPDYYTSLTKMEKDAGVNPSDSGSNEFKDM